MNQMTIVWLIIIVIIVVIIIAVISAFNGLVKAQNSVEEAFSTMDVYMKKRFDLIPNLVETVKGYAAHESETLERIVSARNQIGGASTQESRMEGENRLSGALKNLFAVAESYPDLKANANFVDLQKQLRLCEEDIANSRKYYNAVVKDYNNQVMVFPKNIIANMFHFTKKTMYEVSAAEERETVEVKF
jgi:LemA protein